MLLQALPFAFDSGPLERKNELWKATFSRQENEEPARTQQLGKKWKWKRKKASTESLAAPPAIGIGLGKTLSKYGYAWFLSRID